MAEERKDEIERVVLAALNLSPIDNSVKFFDEHLREKLCSDYQVH
jgi:hypothetical protein